MDECEDYQGIITGFFEVTSLTLCSSNSRRELTSPPNSGGQTQPRTPTTTTSFDLGLATTHRRHPAAFVVTHTLFAVKVSRIAFFAPWQRTYALTAHKPR